MTKLDEIKVDWIERGKIYFPSRLAGKNVEGICAASLDTFTAGCVDEFISEKGKLNKQKKFVIKKSKREPGITVKNLDGANRIYFEELLYLVDKILQVQK